MGNFVNGCQKYAVFSAKRCLRQSRVQCVVVLAQAKKAVPA